jgi:hypothetical protein
MAKQVLSQRDLKHNQQSPFQQRGLLLLALKLTVFIVVKLNQELKKTSNTDDVGGGATTAAQISTIALFTTLKNFTTTTTYSEA